MSQVSGAVVPDRLNGFLSALRNTDNEHRRDGERRLADYVEAERRDLDSDGFAKLDQLIQERINALARGCVLLPSWWNSCTSRIGPCTAEQPCMCREWTLTNPAD